MDEVVCNQNVILRYVDDGVRKLNDNFMITNIFLFSTSYIRNTNIDRVTINQVVACKNNHVLIMSIICISESSLINFPKDYSNRLRDLGLQPQAEI